ncbi:MAG TPA: hypothetical protein VJP77_05270, partial [Planctomycetota bacterium]|nr:hypothetical protein [Planctomycetota bacterium]
MLSLTLALAAAALPQPGRQPGQQPDQPSGQKVADWVAIRAGTIHTVEDGLVVEDGTLLLQGGRIVAVGADVVVPPGVRVVDYGPDAVVVPGLVAADSRLAEGPPSERTAEPG